MRFLLMFVMSAMMVASIGCSSTSTVGCAVSGGVDAILAPAIATALQCSNQASILSSLQTEAKSIGLCTTSAPKGIVANLCSELLSGEIAALGGKLPAAWGCTADNAITALQGLATNACGLIPAKPKNAN